MLTHLLPSSPCRGEAPVSPLLLHLVGPRVKKESELSFLQMEMLGISDRELIQGETPRRVKEVTRAC